MCVKVCTVKVDTFPEMLGFVECVKWTEVAVVTTHSAPNEGHIDVDFVSECVSSRIEVTWSVCSASGTPFVELESTGPSVSTPP